MTTAAHNNPQHDPVECRVFGSLADACLPGYVEDAEKPFTPESSLEKKKSVVPAASQQTTLGTENDLAQQWADYKEENAIEYAVHHDSVEKVAIPRWSYFFLGFAGAWLVSVAGSLTVYHSTLFGNNYLNLFPLIAEGGATFPQLLAVALADRWSPGSRFMLATLLAILSLTTLGLLGDPDVIAATGLEVGSQTLSLIGYGLLAFISIAYGLFYGTAIGVGAVCGDDALAYVNMAICGPLMVIGPLNILVNSLLGEELGTQVILGISALVVFVIYLMWALRLSRHPHLVRAYSQQNGEASNAPATDGAPNFDNVLAMAPTTSSRTSPKKPEKPISSLAIMWRTRGDLVSRIIGMALWSYHYPFLLSRYESLEWEIEPSEYFQLLMFTGVVSAFLGMYVVAFPCLRMGTRPLILMSVVTLGLTVGATYLLHLKLPYDSLHIPVEVICLFFGDYLVSMAGVNSAKKMTRVVDKEKTGILHRVVGGLAASALASTVAMSLTSILPKPV